MIKDERTRDCMSREEMDAVLTSAIPYLWRLSELFDFLFVVFFYILIIYMRNR